MVKIEIKSEYLNVESTKDGDIVEITGEGEFVEEEGRWGRDKGKMIQRLYLPVKVNGTTELVWTPFNSEIKKCIVAWNSGDTKDWVGKKLNILHVDKKMVIRPIANGSPQ